MHNSEEHKCQSSQNICLKISRNGLEHTSLCLVALFLSMVRSKQGTQTPRFLKCYSAVLLFPVKIVSQILQALQFTWHNEDKLLGRNPEVLENWISGSSKKEKTTPQNSKSKNSIYWSYPMHVNGLTWLSNAAALWCVWSVTRSFAATRAQQQWRSHDFRVGYSRFPNKWIQR